MKTELVLICAVLFVVIAGIVARRRTKKIEADVEKMLWTGQVESIKAAHEPMLRQSLLTFDEVVEFKQYHGRLLRVVDTNITHWVEDNKREVKSWCKILCQSPKGQWLEYYADACNGTLDHTRLTLKTENEARQQLMATPDIYAMEFGEIENG